MQTVKCSIIDKKQKKNCKTWNTSYFAIDWERALTKKNQQQQQRIRNNVYRV